MPYDQPTLLAIDPMGCGCTECLTGEYRPLNDATDTEIQALFNDELRDNTGECWQISQNEAWMEGGYTVSTMGRTFTISGFSIPIPVENFHLDVHRDTVEALYGGIGYVGQRP